MYNRFIISSITVIMGVLVFVVERFVEKFCIEPIHSQKQIIGEISNDLIFYANKYSNPLDKLNPDYNEASDNFRRLSSLLSSKTSIIPYYQIFESLHLVLPKNDIQNSVRLLIGLSNSFYTYGADENGNRGMRNVNNANTIRRLLKIPMIE